MIVIGAGAAGLTVARALTRDGVDTVVLEARARIGGRIDTQTIGGVPVDMGAAWVHGTSRRNPVAEIMDRIGVDMLADDVDARMFEPGAGFAPDAAITQLWTHYDRFHRSLGGLRRQLGKNASVADAIDTYLDNEGLAGTDRARVRFGLLTIIVDSYSGEATDQGLQWYWRDGEFSGGDAFPDGSYAPMVTSLAAGSDIRTGEIVRRVAYDRSGITVETETNTYAGSHVVVTLPLGVLKAGSVEFSPELPRKKREAIDALGMGNFEKVILSFAAPFSLADDTLYRSGTYGEWPYFKDLTPYAGAPTLGAFCAGDFGRGLAEADPDEIAERVLAMAREMAGALPDPTDARVSNWTADPFAMGSYSFIPVGGKRTHQRKLAAPVDQRVLFAGEATDHRYFGSVHAAVLSGLREAKRLIGGRVDVDSLFD